MLEIASQLFNGHFRNTFFCSKAGLQMSRKSAILPNWNTMQSGLSLDIMYNFHKSTFSFENDLVMTQTGRKLFPYFRLGFQKSKFC